MKIEKIKGYFKKNEVKAAIAALLLLLIVVPTIALLPQPSQKPSVKSAATKKIAKLSPTPTKKFATPSGEISYSDEFQPTSAAPTSPQATSVPPTGTQPTSAPPTSAAPTSAAPTSTPPNDAPPTKPPENPTPTPFDLIRVTPTGASGIN